LNISRILGCNCSAILRWPSRPGCTGVRNELASSNVLRSIATLLPRSPSWRTTSEYSLPFVSSSDLGNTKKITETFFFRHDSVRRVITVPYSSGVSRGRLDDGGDFSPGWSVCHSQE